MTYVISWEPHGVYKRFEGFVTAGEFFRSQEVVLSDPRIDDMRYIINDWLAVDDYSGNLGDAEYAAAFNRGTSFSNPRLRVAFVTTFPLIRTLITMASPISSLPIKAFNTLEEARDWTQGGD